MASKQVTSVDGYISSQPENIRDTLTLVRKAILKAIPAADETISYKIPTYKIHGRPALYFEGWKRYSSLYPAGPRLLAAFKKELSAYETEGSTIRFPLSVRVPVGLIARIARFRVREIRGKVLDEKE